MSMTFCSGCATEIDSAVLNCPQCGAAQNAVPAATPSVNGFGWYLQVLKQYAIFTGRARRQEYWMFCLFNVLIAIAISVVVGVLGTGKVLINIYQIAVLLPSIAAGVRRLHDTNRSGWWLLVPIANLVFLVEDSQPGNNRFGANPKGIA